MIFLLATLALQKVRDNLKMPKVRDNSKNVKSAGYFKKCQKSAGQFKKCQKCGKIQRSKNQIQKV